MWPVCQQVSEHLPFAGSSPIPGGLQESEAGTAEPPVAIGSAAHGPAERNAMSTGKLLGRLETDGMGDLWMVYDEALESPGPVHLPRRPPMNANGAIRKRESQP